MQRFAIEEPVTRVQWTEDAELGRGETDQIMADFMRTNDNNGQEVWSCRKCGFIKRGQYPPRSHRCLTGNRGRRGGHSNSRSRVMSEGAYQDHEDYQNLRDEITGDESQGSVPSPYLSGAYNSTPVIQQPRRNSH